MQIRIESWTKNHDSQRAAVLGWAKVVLGEGMSVWITVLQSKNGGSYCKLPTCKVGAEYVPAIAWLDASKEKELSELVKQELQKDYLNKNQQEEMDW